MTDTREKVLEFHQTFGHPVRTSPNHAVPEANLRYELIREEFAELVKAIKDNNLVEIADALGDLEYVVEGAALTFGLPEVTFFEIDDNVAELVSDLRFNVKILRSVTTTGDIVEIATALANIKTDIRGIAKNYSIPLDDVITVIHESNMSKLGEDGNPIYFTEGPKMGKVKKGPNFFTPTSKIQALLAWDTEEKAPELEPPVDPEEVEPLAEEELPVEEAPIPKKKSTKSKSVAKEEDAKS